MKKKLAKLRDKLQNALICANALLDSDKLLKDNPGYLIEDCYILEEAIRHIDEVLDLFQKDKPYFNLSRHNDLLKKGK